MNGLEVLFIGMVMMCTSADRGCGFDPDQYAARAFLANVTGTGLNCKPRSERPWGCKGCVGGWYSLHEPSVVFRESDVVNRPSPDQIEETYSCEDGLCRVEPTGELAFKTLDAQGISEAEMEQDLRAVPSVGHFEERVGNLHDDIQDTERAIAWIDLADVGELSTRLVSSTAWRAHPPRDQDNPKFGNMAEAISWKPKQALKLVVSGQNGEKATIEFKSDARIAVINLPSTSRPPGDAKGVIGHFQLFYRLLQGPDRWQVQCRMPRYVGRRSTYNLDAVDVLRWVDDGQLRGEGDGREAEFRTWLKIAEKLGFLQEDARAEMTGDASLCPPSKFP